MRRKTILIVLIICNLLCPDCVHAQKIKIDGVTYTLLYNYDGMGEWKAGIYNVDKNVEVAKLRGEITYKGKKYKVAHATGKCINNTLIFYIRSWCDNRPRLRCVELDSTFRYVPSRLLYESSIEQVVLPNTIRYIMDNAFGGCANLKSIEIPDGVTDIDVSAFKNCKNLSSVIIPSSVKTIGKNAFKGCEKLLAVSVPQDVTIGQDAFASNTKVTRIKNEVHDEQQIKANLQTLPILEIVPGSIAFADATGANVIKANTNYKIQFVLKNTGKGSAKGCTAMISANGSTNGIRMKNTMLPSIAAGQTQTIELPITADMNTVDGEVEFTIQVNEPNGFGTDPQFMTVKTQAFEEPMVQVTDYSLTADGGTTLRKKVPFDLQLLLQNTKHGQADEVEVSVEIPQNVLMIEGKEKEQFGQLAGGETKSLVYSLIVNNNYVGRTIPITVHVKERMGIYAENRTINLQLDQALASTKISIDARQQQPKGDVAIARLGSDVDKDIPHASGQQQKTFAIIIGNEKYTQVAQVAYANNDAKIFSEYCKKTLGLPAQNVRTYENATFGMMLSAVNDIKKIAEAYQGEINVIIYYAGHGVPNEATKDAYLLPADADGRQTEACYPVSRLYKELGEMGAKTVVVFMDACFSGAQRGEGMLASARGVAIKAKANNPEGNMVVFSAATGDETAYPYKEKGHGMFTYFLLKKLRESKGDCTLGELSEYIQTNVRQQSVVVNRKSQTPTIVPSSSMVNIWKDMKLK